MILTGSESGVVKIGFCAHPPISGAKRLLQHNLFNEGAQGECAQLKGGRLPVTGAF